MTEKNRPYTGIAGFTTAEEVRAVAADAPTIACFGTPHFGRRRLAIGVLASWETLNGDPPRRYPERYPPIGRVREIFAAASEPYAHRSPWQGEDEGTVFDLKSRCLRVIHYDSQEPNLLAQLDRLCEIAGPHLDGFQLNMVWPPEDDLKRWAEDHPDMRIVLQVNAKMFEAVKRRADTATMDTPITLESPEQRNWRHAQALAYAIAGMYGEDCITDILFDMSGGTGQAIDIAEAVTVLEALYSAFGGGAKGGINIGIAGGFHWQNVADLQPFFARWPDLSIDAEGRVRDRFYDPKDKSKVVADVLGEAAREYARRAFGVMPLREQLEI